MEWTNHEFDEQNRELCRIYREKTLIMNNIKDDYFSIHIMPFDRENDYLVLNMSHLLNGNCSYFCNLISKCKLVVNRG